MILSYRIAFRLKLGELLRWISTLFFLAEWCKMQLGVTWAWHFNLSWFFVMILLIINFRITSFKSSVYVYRELDVPLMFPFFIVFCDASARTFKASYGMYEARHFQHRWNTWMSRFSRHFRNSEWIFSLFTTAIFALTLCKYAYSNPLQ